jgi:hypothetical protein
MGRAKRERAAKKEVERLRHARNRNYSLAIAGLTAAVIATVGGTMVCSPKPSQKPAKQKKVLYVDGSWDERMLKQGIPIRAIGNHSPSYIAALDRTRREGEFDAGPALSRLYRSGKHSDYTLEALGGMYALSGRAMEKIAKAHDNLFFRQNGFKDVESHAAGKVIHMDDDEAFRNLFNMSYFLGRSTFKAVPMDLDPLNCNLEERMWEGGDCETNSGFVFFNFSRYSRQCGKEHLKKRVRLIEGMCPMSRETGKAHVWLEAYMGNSWIPVDCNIGEHNRLHGQKFNPETNYWKSATIPPEIRKGFTRLIGWEYNPKSSNFQELVYVLPARLEREMRSNGWKPKPAPDVSTDI